MIFSDIIKREMGYILCQTLHDCPAHGTLLAHATFSDRDHTSGSQQCQIFPTKHFLFLFANSLRKFKLCMIVTLVGVYQFIACLLLTTLFQGRMCQKPEPQIVFFFILVQCSLNAGITLKRTYTV